MMKRVLMIAFHFPPLAGSSGIQRTLRFARHLPRFEWEPLVLTSHPRAYERVSDDQMHDADSIRIVERAFALDSARHLALFGRYPAFLARPDRWVTWWLGAVPKGLAMIRKYRPHAIWSTYPIATAHMIASTLHRMTKLPWIADFRDPMAQDGYPADPTTWRHFKRIEEDAMRNASCNVFVTPGAARMYQARYPDVPRERTTAIENGYDEESFVGLDQSVERENPLKIGTLTLVHSGIVYPAERDPTCFFQALRGMLDSGSLSPTELRVKFRAAGHDKFLKALIDKYNLAHIIELAPPIPYRDALQEMMQVNGLLVLQASNCNEQIPAKLYEYLRCRRPILGLTDPSGDTANLLRGAGISSIARLDCTKDIASELRKFIDGIRQGKMDLPINAFLEKKSRLRNTEELSKLLDIVVNT